jgi:hypothetical protein
VANNKRRSIQGIQRDSYTDEVYDFKFRDGERKPVSNSRDTQEIPFVEGKKMIGIFEKYVNTNTILEHFEYYDMRQENYEKNMNLQPPTTQQG